MEDGSWNSLVSEDFDNYMENFSPTMNRLCCECFPTKTKTLTQKRSDNSWITPAIHKLIS